MAEKEVQIMRRRETKPGDYQEVGLIVSLDETEADRLILFGDAKLADQTPVRPPSAEPSTRQLEDDATHS